MQYFDKQGKRKLSLCDQEKRQVRKTTHTRKYLG